MGACVSTTRGDDLKVIDQSDRVFHLEILRGGMNRLLFRSNKSETWPTRVEILFTNVKYLAVATVLHGPVIRRLGSLDECLDLVPWGLDASTELSVYSVRAGDREGLVVGGSLAVDESQASPSDPSRFFMMD